ncbi:unnamed protein product [Brachionus calyciflorus]|uniref:DM10 domain-containing protein n=1 Tax=Brachionus calyciflorus TaxID=104777 RepID=A0A813WHC8_9BILA|nr:unnamed protein product [Brachionus calyciflorus]
MSLPFLPGNSFDRKIGQNKFHLSHHFDKYNGVNLMVGEKKPGVGGEPLRGQDLRNLNSVYPRGEGSDKPAWVAFDKQVLCFDAYFQESVVERPGEQFRIRYVRIYFYLEDDTIHVVEPRTKNAGYNQGTIINRHRIPRPPPYDDTFYTVEDFNVQKEVVFYGKRFKITSCDQFTQNFLTKIGVRVADPIEPPKDPYKGIREVNDGAQNPLRPYERIDTLKQYLDHDRQVLRFTCIWDDRDTKFGELRRFRLHYYLADDTVEILEILAPNSGRDSSSTFLSRQKLPMEIIHMGKPGDKPTRTVLNVIGNFFDGGRYILDNLKTGAINVNYYKDSDLMIGRVINVFGRKVLLTDCDEFTKEFYRNKYGIDSFSPVQYDSGNNMRRVERMNPPYNGFGSEEDSLASCQKMVPEPPKKDFIKWMAYDRNGLESNTLRFLARIHTKDPIQADRRFIVSYFLSDDSIMVHEPPVRNSGINGGRFLERGRVKKPGQPMYSTKLPEYYNYKDMFVGAVLQLNNFFFILYDADEYCYEFMEKNSNMFQYSNLNNVLRKFRSLNQTELIGNLESNFRKNDNFNSGVIGFTAFFSALKNVLGDQLNEQEIITLARSYGLETKKEYDSQSIAAVAQEHLRKNNFDLFARFRDALQSADSFNPNEQSLSVNDARSVIKGFKMPIPDYLLDMLLQNTRLESGNICLRNLLTTLNWRENPVAAPKETFQNIRPDDSKIFETSTLERQQLRVNYSALISELNGN